MGVQDAIAAEAAAGFSHISWSRDIQTDVDFAASPGSRANTKLAVPHSMSTSARGTFNFPSSDGWFHAEHLPAAWKTLPF